jgi:hypothetical protein
MSYRQSSFSTERFMEAPAQALSKMKHRLVTFILDAHKDILQRIEQVIDYISVTIEALRVFFLCGYFHQSG